MWCDIHGETQVEILAGELHVDVNIPISLRYNLSHMNARQFLKSGIIRRGAGESWRGEPNEACKESLIPGGAFCVLKELDAIVHKNKICSERIN